jgi:uncharacterized protein
VTDFPAGILAKPVQRLLIGICYNQRTGINRRDSVFSCPKGSAPVKLDQVINILQKNTQEIERLGVKSLALFGSTVRNEALPTSDVDILVTFVQPPTFDQYIDTKFFLEDLLGCKVDLVMEEGLKPLVRTEIKKEAVYVT